jgi:acetyl esterase/lipase
MAVSMHFLSLVPFAFLLLTGCSTLSAFDSVVAKDKASALVAADQPFAGTARGRLDVYAPRNAGADAKRPVIVWLYGGSWNSGDKDSYRFAGRAFAAQGFVTVVPDYRLVPEVHFPGFLEDNAAAIRWVRANIARYGGDPERIVLVGHSAGAYNAAMLALDPRWLGSGRAAIRGFAGLAGPYDFLPLDSPITRAAFGSAADLAATQPIAFAGAGDPPALLATAGKDGLVPPHHAARLAERLRAAGVPVECKDYPQVGHVGILTAIATPFRGKAPVLADVSDFAHRMTAR